MADFTEVFKQTQGLVSFSPNGEYLATAVQQRLVIRESQSLQILQLFNCTDLIQHVSWSQGSDLILVASYKLGIFQVFSLEDEEWTGKVDEGILGCSKVLWAPDGRNILSFSEYQVSEG
jgi:WD40 repeat protein